jgi:hypothetical protein
MALQSSFAAPQGFTAPAAYTHITTFMGNKAGIRVTYEVHFDKASRDDGKQPIAVEIAQLTIADGATMAQMYTELKGIIKFTGATDV